ncbi:aldolase/citrate lyase family protein [soil metagenome]
MFGSQNRVKQRVREGKTVFGFVCRTLSPTIVELIGLSGFDFVWIDMEHTGADFSTVETLCRAADASDIESLVRVPDKNPANILRALEVGAAIVNVPQVESRAEAEAVVRAAKYAPLGRRGYCASSRGTQYGVGAKATDSFAAANERTMTMVQIESARGVDNATEICQVSGLDVVFVGLADLSQSLGITAQFDHPDLLDSARRVLKASRAAGKISAMLADTPQDAAGWAAEGVQILCCGVDIPMIGKALLRVRAEFGSV